MMNVKVFGSIALGMAMLASHSFGATIIAQETWSNPPSTENWDASDDIPGDGLGAYGTLTGTVGPVGGETDVLQITGGAPDTAPRDFVYTQSAPFIGDYGAMGVQGIWFDFYVDPANGSVPSALQLYFVSDGGGANEEMWFFDLSDSLTTGWNTYGANFNSSSESDPTGFGTWVQYSEFGNTGTWSTDIGNITEIGIELSYLSGVGGQIYAIDNFTLDEDPFLVPEPETYAFIAMALLSLAFVYRKRLEEQFQFAMVHVQGMRMG